MLRTAYDTPHTGAEEPTQSFISMSCDHAKCPTRSFRFFALLRASGIVLALVVLPSTAGSQAAVLRNPASRVASTKGKTLFESSCAVCHGLDGGGVGGKGRFLPTDLGDFAYNHNPSEIRIAIVSPQEQEGVPHTSVSVTTSSGQLFFGLIRNENNSSLQMQDADGQFYLFMKSDLGSIERSPAPPMPVDYKQKLSSTEIEDLVSYIVHQSSIPQVAGSKPTNNKKENRD